MYRYISRRGSEMLCKKERSILVTAADFNLIYLAICHDTLCVNSGQAGEREGAHAIKLGRNIVI